MIRQFCDTLKNAIVSANLPFVDTVAGVVRAIKYNDVDEDGKVRRNIIPVSWDTNAADYEDGTNPARDLVPDSTKKGILYFEDNGARVIGSTSRGLQWEANITLICWYNKELIVQDASGHVQNTFLSMLLKALQEGKFVNRFPFTGVMLSLTATSAQDARTFSKYTYEETQRQFLMQPYEYFNLTFNAKFSVADDACLPSIQPRSSECPQINF